MPISPYVNASLASLYIATLVFIISQVNGPDNIFTPMFALSIFVISASLMGLLFLYQPFNLYFNGQKKEAVNFFLKTLGTFAIFALGFLILNVLLLWGW